MLFAVRYGIAKGLRSVTACQRIERGLLRDKVIASFSQPERLMNFKKGLLLLLVGVGVAYGEGSDTNNPIQDLQQKIDESKKIAVTLPTTTPFDSDPKLRDIYLDQYQAGYRNIVADLKLFQFPENFFKDHHMSERIFNVYMQGWVDGTSKALKDHPEKAPVYPTIDKTGSERISPTPDTGLYIDSSKARVNIQK